MASRDEKGVQNTRGTANGQAKATASGKAKAKPKPRPVPPSKPAPPPPPKPVPPPRPKPPPKGWPPPRVPSPVPKLNPVPLSLGDEDAVDLEFGRDTNRHDYFHVTQLTVDFIGTADYGGDHSTTSLMRISSTNGTASDPRTTMYADLGLNDDDEIPPELIRPHGSDKAKRAGSSSQQLTSDIGEKLDRLNDILSGRLKAMQEVASRKEKKEAEKALRKDLKLMMMSDDHLHSDQREIVRKMKEEIAKKYRYGGGTTQQGSLIRISSTNGTTSTKSTGHELGTSQVTGWKKWWVKLTCRST